MQLLSILLLQFIYIYLSIIIGVPGTDKVNLLKNKIILFTGIFIFEIIIKALYKYKNECKNNFKNFMIDSFFISTLSIVGYSFYIDLSLLDTTKDLFYKSSNDPNLSALLISGIICSLIFLVRTIQLITRTNNECEQNEIY